LFERRTRATFRKAEFGFLGGIVFTWVQTPRFCGAPFGCLVRRCLYELNVNCNAGALLFFDFGFLSGKTIDRIAAAVGDKK
jgi:hypothetical protein